MTSYDTTSLVWDLSSKRPPWLAITAREQHPNMVPLHWIDRRWTSTVDGAVVNHGHVARSDPNTGGHGIVASVSLAGLQVWQAVVTVDDVAGQDFDLGVDVAVGTTVDFIVAPRSSDAYDTTAFTVIITR